jgi:hypothetical protein
MRQYLMQPRRCGAADLRAWRIDRKRKALFIPDLMLASLSVVHFAVRKPIVRETLASLGVVGFARRTKSHL